MMETRKNDFTFYSRKMYPNNFNLICQKSSREYYSTENKIRNEVNELWNCRKNKTQKLKELTTVQLVTNRHVSL